MREQDSSQVGRVRPAAAGNIDEDHDARSIRGCQAGEPSVRSLRGCAFRGAGLAGYADAAEACLARHAKAGRIAQARKHGLSGARIRMRGELAREPSICFRQLERRNANAFDSEQRELSFVGSLRRPEFRGRFALR